MIEAIVLDKLLILGKGFAFGGLIISVFLWFFVMITSLIECYDCGWNIDYYHLKIRENKVIVVTVAICIILTMILLNPLSAYTCPGPDSIEPFEGNYFYLLLYGINNGFYRLISIFGLGTLILLYKSILSNTDKSKYDKYEDINRNKFIKVLLLLIFCLALQISLYLLVPSNQFIVDNIISVEM